MADSADLGCKIFVDTEQTAEELAALLLPVLSGQEVTEGAGVRTIVAPQAEVEIRKNKDFNKERGRVFPDGFLYFAYALEVYPSVGTSRAELVRLTTSILNRLWSQGVPAIAACDYESELPYGGGNDNRSVPWPPEKNGPVGMPRPTARTDFSPRSGDNGS
jgi:hypothetical protein